MRNFALQRRLILVGLALLFAADVALAYFTVRLSGSREERERQLATQTRQVALVRADIARSAEIRKTRPEVLKRLDEFEAALLPGSQGYSLVNKELDQYAKDSHVDKGGLHFKETEESAHNLTALEISLDVSGEYNQIVQFLNRLQRSKSVYIVDGLAVESGAGTVGLVKVNLHLRTYFRKA